MVSVQEYLTTCYEGDREYAPTERWASYFSNAKLRLVSVRSA